MAQAQAGNGKPQRKHRATYARDKKKGGWMVRIAGEYPEKFAGRDVPVETRDGEEHIERMDTLIWSGTDQETGELVALYRFESKPQIPQADLPF